MRAIKTKVALRDIRPSGTNPRQDFGDIGALAQSISATGGEPVNPVIVVEDGNVYRIVDGERRYRALCEIYGKGSDRPVPALVAQGMTDAEEMVAMVATDDKRQLTDAERARGVQQMMALGVDEERAALAAHTTRGRVRAARALSASVPKGCQVTLEQMEAALALPEDRRDEVLAAGAGWRGVAGRISREVELAGKVEADTAAWEAAGVAVADEWGDGLSHAAYADLGRAAEWVEGNSPVTEGTSVVLAGPFWHVLVPKADGGPSPEDAERDLLSRRRESAREDLLAHAAEWVAGNEFDMPPELVDRAREGREGPWLGGCLRGALAALGEDWAPNPARRLCGLFLQNVSQGSAPSRHECGIELFGAIDDAARVQLGTAAADGEVLGAVRLLGRCGFDIGDEGRWLVASLEEEIEKDADREGEDDGE